MHVLVSLGDREIKQSDQTDEDMHRKLNLLSLIQATA